MRCLEREQELFDAELVELVVSAGEASATGPDEIDEPIVQRPTMNSSDSISILNVLTEYCQWQDCVTADHLNLLRMLQGNVADTTAPNSELASLGFHVVPKPRKYPFLCLQLCFSNLSICVCTLMARLLFTLSQF